MDRFVRLRELIGITGLSRSTVYRRMGEGTFPPRLGLGGNVVAWRQSDVERWMADPAGFRADPGEDAAGAPRGGAETSRATCPAPR